VRAGHVSTRKKMITATIARINAISVNASGQEMRAEFADFNIGRSTLSVGRFF
jgi:hypothetical protein